MTVTVVEPTTIEGIDLEGEPECESCESPAVVRCVGFCGCQHPVCHRCHAAGRNYWDQVEGRTRRPWGVRCQLCGRVTVVTPPGFWSQVVVSVVPL